MYPSPRIAALSTSRQGLALKWFTQHSNFAHPASALRPIHNEECSVLPVPIIFSVYSTNYSWSTSIYTSEFCGMLISHLNLAL
jgi:hypothetical protein